MNCHRENKTLTARNEMGVAWMKIPASFDQDAKLLKCSVAARYLFLAMIGLCNRTGSHGVVDVVQVSSCGVGMRDVTSRCGELVVHQLLRYVPEEGAYCVVDVQKWLGSGVPAVSPPQPAKKVTAAQKPNPAPTRRLPREEDSPRAPAPVVLERERDREPIRSPSGSDRIGSAQAAPRDAEGATQPAPDVSGDLDGEPDNFATLSGPALVRAELAKGRKKNPHSTGIDTQLWKYPRDRITEPMPGLINNGPTE